MGEHGGKIVAKVLKSRGVDTLFTLSGGHIFPIYDGCKAEGIRIVDVRHEQTAAFAAEGIAKATRGVGVAALTAGPGVTNGMSAIAGAQATNAPSGPTFLDYPMDVIFSEAEFEVPAVASAPDAQPPAGIEEAAALLAGAERPVIMAGTGLYWARGEDQLRALAEALGIPVFLNGLGRGCLPADHDLAFSRARSTALQGADVALVIGVPLDFRLGFGGSFGEETKLIRLDVAPNALTANRLPDLDLVGDIAAGLAAIAAAAGEGTRSKPWLEQLGNVEREAREAEREQLEDSRSPLHPVRVYGELDKILDRDAIVVGDG